MQHLLWYSQSHSHLFGGRCRRCQCTPTTPTSQPHLPFYSCTIPISHNNHLCSVDSFFPIPVRARYTHFLFVFSILICSVPFCCRSSVVFLYALRFVTFRSRCWIFTSLFLISSHRISSHSDLSLSFTSFFSVVCALSTSLRLLLTIRIECHILQHFPI